MKGKKEARRIPVKLHISEKNGKTRINTYKDQCRIEIGNFVFEMTTLVTFIDIQFVTFTKLLRK